MHKSIIFLSKKNFDFNKEKLNDSAIWIIIPALREQKNILGTLEYLLKITHNLDNIHIVVATTEQEDEIQYIGDSTQQIVNNFIEEKGLNNVTNIHFPKKDGHMSHQLNYTVTFLREDFKLHDDSYIAVYNADSRPHPLTFHWVLNRLSKTDKIPKVLQQSSIFLKNIKQLHASRNWFVSGFLISAALLQTRWTLSHEVSRLLRTVSKNKYIAKFSNAHCVGHGLFIRSDALKEVVGFSEDTMTEDLFLGFLLRSHGYEIEPIPLLELSDSPTTIKRVLRQKYVWFWGPMLYPKYFIHYVKNSNEKLSAYATSFIFMIQGLLSALSWVSSGFIVLFVLIYPLVSTFYHLYIFTIISVAIYGPMQYWYIIRKIERLEKIDLPNKFSAVLQSIPNIVLHSIPPYFSIFAEIKRQLFGIKLLKPKTEDD